MYHIKEDKRAKASVELTLRRAETLSEGKKL